MTTAAPVAGSGPRQTSLPLANDTAATAPGLAAPKGASTKLPATAGGVETEPLMRAGLKCHFSLPLAVSTANSPALPLGLPASSSPPLSVDGPQSRTPALMVNFST